MKNKHKNQEKNKLFIQHDEDIEQIKPYVKKKKKFEAKNRPHSNGILTCGMCRFFNNKFRGKTCQDLYGIGRDDRACIKFERPTGDCIDFDIVKEDDTIQSAFAKIEKKRYTEIRDNSILKELKDYFIMSVKVSESVKRECIVTGALGSKSFYLKLDTLFGKVQAYRDRVVEILLSYTSVNSDLNFIWEMCEAHIIKNYANYLKNFNVKEKDVIIADILAPISDIKHFVKKVIDNSRLVLDNINNTYFILKEKENISSAMRETRRMKMGSYEKKIKGY